MPPGGQHPKHPARCPRDMPHVDVVPVLDVQKVPPHPRGLVDNQHPARAAQPIINQPEKTVNLHGSVTARRDPADPRQHGRSQTILQIPPLPRAQETPEPRDPPGPLRLGLAHRRSTWHTVVRIPTGELAQSPMHRDAAGAASLHVLLLAVCTGHRLQTALRRPRGLALALPSLNIVPWRWRVLTPLRDVSKLVFVLSSAHTLEDKHRNQCSYIYNDPENKQTRKNGRTGRTGPLPVTYRHASRCHGRHTRFEEYHAQICMPSHQCSDRAMKQTTPYKNPPHTRDE